MSDRDLPNMDDVELPDIPDDDGEDGAETLGDAGSRGAPAGGRFGPLLARIAPVAQKVGALTAPIGAKAGAGALAAPIGAMVGSVAAPVGKAVAPTGALAGPLLARVPRPIMGGVGAFVGVLFLIVLLSATVASGRGSAEASAAPVKAAPVRSSAPVAAPPKATAKPAYTPTPAGPAPTATPAVFAPHQNGWLAIGRALPNPREKLIRDQMHFFDDERASYRVVANLSVLVRSGPMAPLWGIVLGFQDEANHLRLEFFTDSYNQNLPFVGLFLTKNGKSRLVGPSTRLPNMEYWGRDKHEVVVDVNLPEIVATLDGEPLGRWQYQDSLAPVKKTLYVWGASRVRFESVEIE